MAKAPAPKGNFLQTFLFAIAIFMAFQLLFPNRNSTGTQYKNGEVKTSAEVRTALLDANARLYDVSANRLYQTYDKMLAEEVKEKKLSEADAQARRIEAAVLTADTQYKAGVARNETARMRNAYHTLINLNNRLEGTPEWNRELSLIHI